MGLQDLPSFFRHLSRVSKAATRVAITITFMMPLLGTEARAASCARTITADVVALDQSIVLNRFGAIQPHSMMFALKRDVVSTDGSKKLSPGKVKLRDDKRPRPLVLRMNEGDCLTVNFTNLLAKSAQDDQPATRNAGIHVNGLQLVDDIGSDGSNVGNNASSLVAPGQTAVYNLYAEKEGTYFLYSTGAMTGGEGNSGSTTMGLFGAINVQPPGAEWYRSQLTRAEMDMLAAEGNMVNAAATNDKNDNENKKNDKSNKGNKGNNKNNDNKSDEDNDDNINGGNQPGDEVPPAEDVHPIINYEAVYPSGHRFAGTPILKMLHNNEIIHSDLTAIITGPGRGDFNTWYVANPSYPNRNQPFREFTIILHDEFGPIQAFPELDARVFKGIRDGMGLNYGSAALGSILLANRLEVGPNRNCAECMYEDMSFLSWANGDPAMIVDIPANVEGQATKALYADDPSNVYHSYLNDHVKFRIHSAGYEHHIFHLHAHQWLYNPDDDNSVYLDSQAIGPGASYTLEIAFDGSGNRNKIHADSIFHCHFYPHFASGMWGLWRVHDVLELGTELDGQGRPVHHEDEFGKILTTARALPDGEIITGTPIPGVVPIPTLAMAPLPGPVQLVAADLTGDGFPDSSQIDLNGDGIPDFTQVAEVEIDRYPGYPFYMPAVAGHEPPHPPLAMVEEEINGEMVMHDGGLPRHVLAGGERVFPPLGGVDFTTKMTAATAYRLPHHGTEVEHVAMEFHAQPFHPTFNPAGNMAQFKTNGMPPVAGAPFADPCRLDDGTPVTVNRRYKGAHIDLDLIINKAEWHYPLSHITALWEDVAPLQAMTKAPEPFIIRANSGDCIEHWHTALMEHIVPVDDFQVAHNDMMTGQHIHLVKFDAQASNGGSTGFNYEDSTMTPGVVRQHIKAINARNGIITEGGDKEKLQAAPHPFFGDGKLGLGAQTVAYRWYADPIVNKKGVDRTLGNVFTHDHMTPSTNQQTGLYGVLVIEPKGSTWRNPETGEVYGSRHDGGPTSWRADILTQNQAESFREFTLMFQDFHLAYTKDGIPVNPPGRHEVGLPFLLEPPAMPQPEAIAAEDPGTFSVNYRNEPLALRVRDPHTNKQAAGQAGDLSYAFSSRVERADGDFNRQPDFYPPLTADLQRQDPFTPMMRVYENDRVRLRVLTGAQEEGHTVTMHGVKWLQEPASPNSGYRSAQMMGISEQFIFDVPVTPTNANRVREDYLWSMGTSADGYWNGIWGLMRAYPRPRGDLLQLPSNPIPQQGLRIRNNNEFIEKCPRAAPVRRFDVTAVTADDALPGGRLVYNQRMENGGPLHDPTAILYVRTEDLDEFGRLKPGVPVEPLILRANAGECIQLDLRNQLPDELPDPDHPDTWGFSTLPMIVNHFNSNQLRPSSHVGLHAQRVAYDIASSDGANIGVNPPRTVEPGGVQTFRWYAGDVSYNRTIERLNAMPVEFGAINLISSDRIKHSNKGAIGGLIIEPSGSTFMEDEGTRASATITPPDGPPFREFVLLFQDDINLRFGSAFLGKFKKGEAVPNVDDAEDPQDTGQKAINYRTEPFWFRLGFAPDTSLMMTRQMDFTDVLSNSLLGGKDPETPVFTAKAGDPIRFRILQPGGNHRSHSFVLHGHIWEKQPYTDNSTRLGDNPLSFWVGAQEGHGPANHFDIIPKHGAGGKFRVSGDYLYRDHVGPMLDGGIWGIFRVE
jgi:manganese oxidase